MRRKWALFLVALLLAGSAFGQEERTITLLHGGDPDLGGWTRYTDAAERMQADYPGVTVEMLQVDLSDGSTLTMDALNAAGDAPNVYVDFIGRVSKSLVPEYALDLNGYIRDLDQYVDLKPYTRDGAVLGLPDAGGAQGMAVNMDLMREIGFTPTWDWTVEDFLKMAELVKQHEFVKVEIVEPGFFGRLFGRKPKEIRTPVAKYATGMFAANQSGDYLINNWFATFGAEYYADGYDYTTIAEGGAKVYEFFQTLVRNGYIPPDSATLTDDDYVLQWARGELAATAFFPAWVKPYIDTVVANGTGKPFEYQFFPFPGQAPTYVSAGAFVVHKTGTEADKWAARFVEYANGVKFQEYTASIGSVPPRRDVSQPSDPRVAETSRIMADFGVFDLGSTMPFFARTRPQHFPILQRVLKLEVTPEDAIREYAAAINKAIADE